jgi:predicted DNA-binding protein (UPF0251 family)
MGHSSHSTSQPSIQGSSASRAHSLATQQGEPRTNHPGLFVWLWNIPSPCWMDAVFPPEVETVLQKLDPLSREIVLLRVQRDMKQDEISDALGVAQGTVSKRLTKARRFLPHLPRRLSSGRHHVQSIGSVSPHAS